MKVKKIIITLGLILSILPTGYILAQSTDENLKNDSQTASIQKLIEDHTPAFITRIIDNTINTIEKFRIGTGEFLDEKRIRAKKELQKETPLVIKDSVKDVTSADSTQETFDQVVKEAKKGIFVKPFKYLELTFLTITSSFFKHKAVFYIVSIIIIFLVFRALTKQ